MAKTKQLTKEERKAAAAVSRERLRRISKTRHHYLRTNARVMKYGAKSFARNTWLSIAAIAIMAVTLIVLSVTLIATHALSTTIDKIEQQIDMSIYIKQGTSSDQIDRVIGRMTQLKTVLEVKSSSPEEQNNEAIKRLIETAKITDKDYIQSLYEAPNKMSWVLNVKLINLDDTSELENFVDNDESMEGLLDENRPPSYATSRRETIDRIAAMMRRIELIGLIAAGIFAIIAILVVFNTIRMTIFNRKEEIYMMRLVGASRWFVVGPFVVEAALYGIIAALFTGAAVYSGTFALRSSFVSTLDPTIEIMKNYWYLTFSALILAGILIGVVSSLLATRKYLRQK
jgi:cell division transport system permease protein